MAEPVLMAAQLALSGLFAVSAWAKVADLNVFEFRLRDYALLPKPTISLAARLIPACEAASAVALPFAPGIGLALAIVLLTGFTLAVAVNLRRGKTIPCGCAFSSSSIGTWLVLRNCLAATAAIGVASSGRVTLIAVPLVPVVGLGGLLLLAWLLLPELDGLQRVDGVAA